MYWRDVWIQSENNSYQRAILALIILNGINAEDVCEIDKARWDLDTAWFEAANGNTYPLVTQCCQSLKRLEPIETKKWVETVKQIVDTYPSLIEDTNRLLAGALWTTNGELQHTLALTGTMEAPILPLRFTFPFSVIERLSFDERSDISEQAREAVQNAADWLQAELEHQPVSILQRLISIFREGSLVFLLASTAVNGLNLIHNVLMGRLLSPSEYSQLTFVITLQLLVALVPTVFQTVVARFSARYTAQSDEGFLSSLYSSSSRLGWAIGITLAIILLVLSPVIVSIFKLNDPGVILPVVLAVPFFVKAGVDRGVLQGVNAYFWLTGAYVSEGVTRLVMSVVLGYGLLVFGRSLEGTIWGLAQSMIIIWVVGWIAIRHLNLTANTSSPGQLAQEQSEWTLLARATAIALIGQMLITNSDFILVKNFFSPDEAGLYAAISVLGRIVYFGALPLTILLVPMISRRQALNQSTRPILILLVVGGSLICGLLVILAAVFAPIVLTTLYGEAYAVASGLLAPYALAASLYTLTNLVITYQLSLGAGREAMLPIVAGVAQIVLVFFFHTSLLQVILIQIILMSALFVTVLWRVLRLRESGMTSSFELGTG